MPDPNDTLLNEPPPQVDDFGARVQFFAKALAYGVFRDRWTGRIGVSTQSSGGTIYEIWQDLGYNDYEIRLSRYLRDIWGQQQPRASFLEIYGYLERKANHANGIREYLLTPKALALLDQPRFRKVFISYRRQESSAFALLLHDRLKQALFDPFIDLRAIEPGAKFQERIDAEIDASEVFICLVGKTTLASPYVIIEIDRALSPNSVSRGLLAVPIWHNDFSYIPGTLANAKDAFFNQTNAIVVNPENVNGYENAFRELIQFLQQPTP